MSLFTNQKLKAIQRLASTHGKTGGLLKRIDENRELLQLLYEKAPTLMREHRRVAAWVAGNDAMFVELQKILGIEGPEQPGFPRPMPQPANSLDELQGLRNAFRLMGLDPAKVAQLANQQDDSISKSVLFGAMSLSDEALKEMAVSVPRFRQIFDDLR